MKRAAWTEPLRSMQRWGDQVKAVLLNDAAMLIANGATITDAASSVGYTSPSQFSREFKRHFGATPRAWSSSALADPQTAAAR